MIDLSERVSLMRMLLHCPDETVAGNVESARWSIPGLLRLDGNEIFSALREESHRRAARFRYWWRLQGKR